MKNIIYIFLLFFTFTSYAQLGNFGGLQENKFESSVFERGLGNSLFLNKSKVEPGDTFEVLLDLKMKEGWFVYWQVSGGATMKMDFAWETPEEISLVEMKFPYPKYKFDKSLNSAAFYNAKNPRYVAVFKVADDAKPGNIQVGMKLNWQACEEGGQCIQPFTGPTLYNKSIEIAAESKVQTDNEAIFKEAEKYFATKAGSDWGIHAQQTTASFQGRYDDAPSEQPIVRVTISAPEDLDKLSTMFFPITESAHDQSNHNPINQITSKIIQRDFELTLDEGQKLTELEGVLTYKSKTGDTESLYFSTKVSDKAFELKADGPQELPYRNLSGENIESDSKNKGVLYYLILAFFGGFILNLMPCVFPVLSIKVMGFVNQAKEGKGHGLMHAGIFTLGVLISFWILAGVTLSLKSAEQGASWGFQLQNPYMMFGLIIILFALSLNLFGVFEIGVSLTSAGQAVQGKQGFYGSFMSGVLATVVATPCMAPMLGAALAFAFTQPPAIAMIFFTFIALGLSSPYLFLAIFPQFLKFIPKPGAWMETFKQAMGFLMMLAVVWLMETLQSLMTEPEKFFNVLWAFTVFGTALWVYGKYSPMYVEKPKRIKGILAALIIGIASITYGVNKLEEKTVLTWEKFDEAKLDKYLSENKKVFIDFTATWCATCQVNKKIAIIPNAKLFEQKGVILMKGDNTKHDPIINKWLDTYDSPGVPLNLLYDGKNLKPIKFPETFTKGILTEQLEKLDDK